MFGKNSGGAAWLLVCLGNPGDKYENTRHNAGYGALQALAKYRSDTAVSDAVERGLAWLAWQQEPDGTFISWEEVNSESVCQVIVALTELGISLDDERFAKHGATLEDVLLRFAQEDGSFAHTLDGEADLMATTQALYALAAIKRQKDGKTTLYDMSDVS